LDEGDESAAEAAMRQAQAAFEGSFAQPGERDRSPYLQRSFDAFEDIAPTLAHWAQTLYGGLLAQVQLTPAPASGEGA
jgi:hypothetical protein